MIPSENGYPVSRLVLDCYRGDILRAVNGAASLTAGGRKRWEFTFAHRRVRGVPRPRYSYPVRDSEVSCYFLSVSLPLPQGISCESRVGIPRLSDCPGLGAVVPPRLVCDTVPNGRSAAGRSLSASLGHRSVLPESRRVSPENVVTDVLCPGVLLSVCCGPLQSMGVDEPAPHSRSGGREHSRPPDRPLPAVSGSRSDRLGLHSAADSGRPPESVHHVLLARLPENHLSEVLGRQSATDFAIRWSRS